MTHHITYAGDFGGEILKAEFYYGGGTSARLSIEWGELLIEESTGSPRDLWDWSNTASGAAYQSAEIKQLRERAEAACYAFAKSCVDEIKAAS